MTYAETKTLLDAIANIECFTLSSYRQINRDDTDWDEIEKCDRWAAEAKQQILDLCNKLASKEG